MVNKILNRLTKQAANVMVSSNKVLDRFLLEVLLKLYPNASPDELHTFRRFCNLSIFTSGTETIKTDSFFNKPHVDKNDVFFKEFQKAAQDVLDYMKVKHADDDLVLRDISYLEKLAIICGGFSVPTTCGYSILKCSESDKSVHSYFAMLGLGVAVKICHKSYHYFFGSSFRHCTPAAITIDSKGMIASYSNGDVNIVGWGGAQSVRRQVYNQFNGPAVPRLFPAAFYNWLRTCNNPRAIEAAERRTLIAAAERRVLIDAAERRHLATGRGRVNI